MNSTNNTNNYTSTNNNVNNSSHSAGKAKTAWVALLQGPPEYGRSCHYREQ